MGPFSRRAQAPAPDHDAAIGAFWEWWAAEGRAMADAALASGDVQTLVDPLTIRVHAISEELAWELGSGAALGSEHELTVTAEGNADVRALARRWLRAAPATDAAWAFADLKQRAPDVSEIQLGIGRETLSFADVLVGARVVGHHVDVTVHHPAFERLDEGTRQQVAYIALDSAVGEETVESWLGEVTPSPVPPIDGFPLVHVAGFLDDHARARRDQAGNPIWALLQGTGPAGPVTAMAQVPLASVTAPLLDTHVGVLVPFGDSTEEGFPGPGSLDALRALEEHVLARLEGQGRLVAHETSGGATDPALLRRRHRPGRRGRPRRCRRLGPGPPGRRGRPRPRLGGRGAPAHVARGAARHPHSTRRRPRTRVRQPPCRSNRHGGSRTVDGGQGRRRRRSARRSASPADGIPSWQRS